MAKTYLIGLVQLLLQTRKRHHGSRTPAEVLMYDTATDYVKQR
jgi:hypothetical protein